MTGMKQILLLLAGCLILTACNSGYTPQPRATNFPAIQQNHIRSAAHWQLMANNEVASLVSSIPFDASVAIRPAGDESSPFEQAYRRMLTAALVEQGIVVALSSDTATHYLNYDLQMIRHSETDNDWLPRPGTASAWIAIATASANVRNWTNQEYALIPLALGLDVFMALWRDTEVSVAEIIVHSQLQDDAHIVAANSHVYYFNGEDIQQYQDQGKAFPVVSQSARTLSSAVTAP